MASSRKARIRFGCPRCLSRVEAPQSHVGAKLRCPFCHAALVVPKESSATHEGEEYAMSGPTGRQPGAETWHAYLAVVCPVCSTRMYATEDQVGQEMACPDCGTTVTVRRPAEAPLKDTPQANITEEYPLYRGGGQPPPSSREVYQAYIPVVCPVCKTRMLATQEQVGQQLVCPDCDTPTVVPPPAAKVALEEALEAARARREDAYGARAPAGPPPGPQSVHPSYVAVICRVCHTRLHATADQVGQKIICPDCYTPLVVPRLSAPAPAVQAPAEPVEDYRVETPVERPPVIVPGYEPIVDNRPLRPVRASDQEEEERGDELPPDTLRDERPRALRRQREAEQAALRWPFFTGIVDFPFYASSWGTLTVLCLGLIPLVFLIWHTIALADLENVVTWMGSMVFAGVSLLGALMWGVFAAARFMAIVRDTAAGADEVEMAPDMPWLDRVFELVYPVFGLAMTVLLGVAIDRLLVAAGLVFGPGTSISVFLLFPVVLLSMLEAGSPLAPFSPPVWQSLLRYWWAWALFYVESLLLAAAVVLVVCGAVLMAGQLGAMFAAVVVVWAIMVYCRLLGRLAWCCAGLFKEGET